LRHTCILVKKSYRQKRFRNMICLFFWGDLKKKKKKKETRRKH